jgi:hypothetical protein
MSARVNASITTLAAVVVSGFVAANPAAAQITGFGGAAKTGWTANTNTAGLPNVTGTGTASDVLQLTAATTGNTTSYWFNIAQNITNFTESFAYTNNSGTGSNPADGIGVVWQGTGTTVLGGGGSNLGIAGIPTSASLAINIYSLHVVGSQFNNTVTAGDPVTTYNSANINIASGDPINVSLSYRESDGSLTETMSDPIKSATFTRVWRGISIQGQVGGPTAYVGFTGATGAEFANQTVTNFHFTSGNATSTPVATITPIAATGYSQNVIVSKANGTANMTATIDEGTNKFANSFYEAGQNPNASAPGVPHAGVFGSEADANHAFLLQPNGLGQNDAVMVDQTHTTGTLTLTTPVPYLQLSFLVAGSHGGANMGLTLHYAGGATQSATLNVQDWFNGTSTVAWDANGRVYVNSDGTINNSTGYANTDSGTPKMYQLDLTPTDMVDALQSISFTWQGSNGAGDHEYVFGISGAAVPEPSTLMLLSSVGMSGLLIRRRAARRDSTTARSVPSAPECSGQRQLANPAAGPAL